MTVLVELWRVLQWTVRSHVLTVCANDACRRLGAVFAHSVSTRRRIYSRKTCTCIGLRGRNRGAAVAATCGPLALRPCSLFRLRWCRAANTCLAALKFSISTLTTLRNWLAFGRSLSLLGLWTRARS